MDKDFFVGELETHHAMLYRVAYTILQNDDACRDAAFNLAQDLRRAGLAGTLGFEPRSVKSAMRQADKSRARFALLLGPDELAHGNVMLKHMESGEQCAVPRSEAAARIGALSSPAASAAAAADTSGEQA